jgi:hypothetical protein
MVSFSTDADISKYEPMLFGELHLPWQVLAAGSVGVLSGTSFAAEGADFVGAKVSAGGVIHLRSADGTLDGAYEIVSVDSATELTVSVLRPDAADEAIAPPAGTDISYRVSTFAPQAGEAGFRLTEYFGFGPATRTAILSRGHFGHGRTEAGVCFCGNFKRLCNIGEQDGQRELLAKEPALPEAV